MTMGDLGIALFKLIVFILAIRLVVFVFYDGPTLVKCIKRIVRDIRWRTEDALKDWRELLYGKDENNGCKDV